MTPLWTLRHRAHVPWLNAARRRADQTRTGGGKNDTFAVPRPWRRGPGGSDGRGRYADALPKRLLLGSPEGTGTDVTQTFRRITVHATLRNSRHVHTVAGPYFSRRNNKLA
jgi:hypothetical protein